jgi:hypothetical protein
MSSVPKWISMVKYVYEKAFIKLDILQSLVEFSFLHISLQPVTTTKLQSSFVLSERGKAMTM